MTGTRPHPGARTAVPVAVGACVAIALVGRISPAALRRTGLAFAAGTPLRWLLLVSVPLCFLTATEISHVWRRVRGAGSARPPARTVVRLAVHAVAVVLTVAGPGQAVIGSSSIDTPTVASSTTGTR